MQQNCWNVDRVDTRDANVLLLAQPVRISYLLAFSLIVSCRLFHPTPCHRTTASFGLKHGATHFFLTRCCCRCACLCLHGECASHHYHNNSERYLTSSYSSMGSESDLCEWSGQPEWQQRLLSGQQGRHLANQLWATTVSDFQCHRTVRGQRSRHIWMLEKLRSQTSMRSFLLPRKRHW